MKHLCSNLKPDVEEKDQIDLPKLAKEEEPHIRELLESFGRRGLSIINFRDAYETKFGRSLKLNPHARLTEFLGYIDWIDKFRPNPQSIEVRFRIQESPGHTTL